MKKLFLFVAFFLALTSFVNSWSVSGQSETYRASCIYNTGYGSIVNSWGSCNLDTQTLISAGKMNSNCSDWILGDINGTTINNTLVKSCNTTTSVLFFRDNFLATGNTTLYNYYGSSTTNWNRSATAVWNDTGIQEVFLFDNNLQGSFNRFNLTNLTSTQYVCGNSSLSKYGCGLNSWDNATGKAYLQTTDITSNNNFSYDIFAYSRTWDVDVGDLRFLIYWATPGSLNVFLRANNTGNMMTYYSSLSPAGYTTGNYTAQLPLNKTFNAVYQYNGALQEQYVNGHVGSSVATSGVLDGGNCFKLGQQNDGAGCTGTPTQNRFNGVWSLLIISNKSINTAKIFSDANFQSWNGTEQQQSVGSITLNISSPLNQNYSSYTIPFNFTVYGSATNYNVTINSSCNNNSIIYNVTNNSWFNSTLTCNTRLNEWVQVNVTDVAGTLTAQLNNSFQILFGTNFSLLNAGNLTILGSFNLNVSNSTYTKNFSNINSGYYVDYDNLPLPDANGNLTYNFIPLQAIYYYPDYPNLNGSYSDLNNSINNVSGKTWPIQNFLAKNSSGYFPAYTLNVTYLNGTSFLCTSTNFNCTFSLSAFVNSTVYFNALEYGNSNSSLNRTFNSSSPYLNYTFSMLLAGLNLSVFQEFTSQLINATFTLSNSSFTYTDTFNNLSGTSTLYNFSLLPLGSGLLLQLNSSGYYPRQYLVTLDAFSITQLNAYLPVQNAFTGLVRFHIQGITQNNIQGASVVIQRATGGNWFSVGSELSDATGTASFYMDSSQQYRIVVTFGSATGTLTIFPTNTDYIITLTGTTGNYTYTFQNTTLSFFPTQFTTDAQYVLFGCNFGSGSGALVNFSVDLYGSNNSLNYSSVYSNLISGSVNGGTIQVNKSTINYTNFIMVCNFTNLNGFFYSTSYNYSVGQIVTGNIGLTEGLTLLSASNSWIVELLMVFVAVILSFMFGGGNPLISLSIGLAVLGFFTVTGFFSPILFGVVVLVGVFLMFRYLT